MLDLISLLPRSNLTLEWNLLFESRWINTLRGGAGLGLIGSAKGGFGWWPKLGRERERGSGEVVAHGGARVAGRWWLQAEGVAGGSLVWFGQREERGEESKRERERDMLE